MPVAQQAAPSRSAAAAASAWTAALLDGPVRTAGVVSAGAHALYVSDGGSCVAVLGREAIAVPCGLRTRLAALPRVAAVTLGGGCCVVGDHRITVRRLVDVGVPRLGWLDPRALPTIPGVAAVRSELPADALERLRDADPVAVPALLGRGSGLTPVGDDVLAGWLVACHATGTDAAPVADSVAGLAPTRTTTISAALLGHAARGECVPQLRTLLAALHAGADVAPALDNLLAVGHTSGTGLALGAALALDHPSVLNPSVRRPHR